MRNEEFLHTKKNWIRLSDQQRNVLDEARTMELKDGEAFFLYGDFGSGKTVLGIEIARIIASRRKLANPGKKIKLVFTAPKEAEFLLNYHLTASFTMEKRDNVRVIGMETLLQEAELEFVDIKGNSVSTVQILAKGLKVAGSHILLIIDEIGQYNRDWSQLQLVKDVDIVIIPKQDRLGKEQIYPPSADNGVRVHRLTKSYRQSLECLRAHQYISSHRLIHSILDFENFEENRLPCGESTLWIEVTDERICKMNVLDKVKEELAGETSLVVYTVDKEIKQYCTKLNWACGTHLFGFEANVSMEV